jgi:membrane associated rhomboid family serine protease
MKNFSITYTFLFMGLLFMLYFLEFIGVINVSSYCLSPRNTNQWIGILMMPLLHGSWSHLFSNLFSYILLSLILFLSYARVAKYVFWIGFIFTNILLWLVGPSQSCHIGASGLIYTIAFFLIVSGFIRRDLQSMMVSIVVVIFNAGLVAGLLPLDTQVSWQGHLCGAIIGSATAYLFRNIDRVEGEYQLHSGDDKRKRFFEVFLD